MKLFPSFLSIAALCILVLTGCQDKQSQSENPVDGGQIESGSVAFYPSSKPCTRWWWFATEIKKSDVKYQLDWAKQNNFGGVEIAWVYPLYRYDRIYVHWYNRHYPKDTSAQEWLSAEWSEVVAYTKAYADSIGLACDFTLGSAWPVAAGNLDPALGTKIYGDSAFKQELTFAWSWPDTFLVIDHLNPAAFKTFADPIGEALQDALKGSKSALFTDSWEIQLNATKKIWTTGFEQTFQKAFGYDILPFMEDSLDNFPDVRYDYMLHLDEYVTNGFYKPFVQKCRELGAWSRVQCLASPTDVMTTYSLVDIPETESMLNNPNYSRVVSSSAALAGKPLVSCETFTCMYGFPGTYLREEQTADVKMVADAMFAQGVNQHFYHGMPYNPAGSDSIDFFATVYVGPGGSLTEELPAMNAYLEKVSGYMQKGRTYTDVAVYVPYEDAVMKGALPKEKRRKWVWGEYELRYIDPPAETEGYHPLWINRHFLEQAVFDQGKLWVGNASFSTLYVDVDYMDVRALRKLLALAKQGLPVCLKRNPKQPGKVKAPDYGELVAELAGLANVGADFQQLVGHAPLIQGDSLPWYWCRVEPDGTHYLFLAQRLSKHLKYPVYSGQSLMEEAEMKNWEITVNGNAIRRKFVFEPYQSMMLKISPQGDMEFIDISFVPKDPVVRPREKQRMYF